MAFYDYRRPAGMHGPMFREHSGRNVFYAKHPGMTEHDYVIWGTLSDFSTWSTLSDFSVERIFTARSPPILNQKHVLNREDVP